MNELQKQLFALQDLEYREFHAKLMPTVEKERIIGIRTPVLRKFAKEFAKSEQKEEFLHTLPHQYYEENNLHGFLLEEEKDYDRLITQLDLFLPHVDNWATCDMMRPKVLKKHLPELKNKIEEWMNSERCYTIRYGIGLLLSFYLEDAFETGDLERVASIRSEEYYVKMMVAWYFATALAKQWDEAVIYIEEKTLESWIHNKTIQKAVESYRIPSEKKSYLKTLKIAR